MKQQERHSYNDDRRHIGDRIRKNHGMIPLDFNNAAFAGKHLNYNPQLRPSRPFKDRLIGSNQGVRS